MKIAIILGVTAYLSTLIYYYKLQLKSQKNDNILFTEMEELINQINYQFDYDIRKDVEEKFLTEIKCEKYRVVIESTLRGVFLIHRVIGLITQQYELGKHCSNYKKDYLLSLKKYIENKHTNLTIDYLPDTCLEKIYEVNNFVKILEEKKNYGVIAQESYDTLIQTIKNSFVKGKLSKETINEVNQSILSLNMFLKELIQKSNNDDKFVASQSQESINISNEHFQSMINSMRHDINNNTGVF